MSDDILFEELPADPEQAFLLLEKRFRTDCQDKINNAHDQERTDVFYVDYIAQVLAAITELGLEAEFSSKVPRIEEVDYNTYLNFSKDVKHFRTMLEIRHGRRVQGLSVRFDSATKQKIHYYLAQIRNIVDKLELEPKKKEALFNKIGGLEAEVDRTRTRYDAFGALVIESAGILGASAEKLEPVRKFLETIAELIWGARKEEETKQLPPPMERKRIEPPRPTKRDERHDTDDEIPF